MTYYVVIRDPLGWEIHPYCSKILADAFALAIRGDVVEFNSADELLKERYVKIEDAIAQYMEKKRSHIMI